jgi:hypothetical protein
MFSSMSTTNVNNPATNAPENYVFTIAFTVIIGFITIFLVVLVFKDNETLQTVSSIWGVWIGAVIGYYFGARQVSALSEDNKNLSTELGKTQKGLDSVSREKDKLKLKHSNILDKSILSLQLYQRGLPEKHAPSEIETIIDDLQKEKSNLDSN